MNRNELNLNFQQALYYYINTVTPNSYYDNFGTVCSLGYDPEYNIIINQWYLDNVNEPTIETLLQYTVQEVTNFFVSAYNIPNQIKEKNNNYLCVLSQSEVNSIPPTRLNELKGMLIFITDTKNIISYTGTQFITIV
jgi:hypothetical protein